MKLKHISNGMVLFAWILFANNSFSQINLVSNGFESGDTWTISNGTPTLNELTGSTDTPANSRIRSGSKSWLINNTTETIEFSSQTVTGETGVKAIVHLSSTSASSVNGADNGDYVRIWANVNGTGFPTDPDIELTGTSNAKWDYNANLTATTVAGTSISTTAPQGGTNANNYATLVITIPDGSTSVALKIEAKNDDQNEFWNIDDVTLSANNTSPTVGFASTTSTETEMTSTFTSANIPIKVVNYDGNQIDIDVNVTGGTAESGDYTFTSPTSLSFTANETKNITFDVHDDVDSENETLIFTITETSSVTGLVISQATHTVTIADDDLPSLIITEVTDPADELEARFVEIYNNGTTAIDLATSQIHFVKQVNAGSSHPTIALTGTMQPNTVYIIGNSANVNTHYGFASDIDFSATNGNGDDAYFLYFGGDKDSGTLLDAYGVLGIDGTGEAWEYANTRAYRTNPKTVLPNATWTASEWTVEVDPKNMADMTPGALENEFRYDDNWKPRDVYANITASDDILILSNITLTDAITAKNFDVNASIDATISSGKSLIVSGTSTGNITYNLDITDTNWHLVSSPVVGEQYNNAWISANSIASGTGNNRGIAPYNNSMAQPWEYFQANTNITTTFVAGIGYAALRTTTGIYSFTGTFPTSDISPAITQSTSNWNLLGNPYPSYIDIAEFITANTSNFPEAFQAVYVWNGTSPTTGNYNSLTTGHIHPGQGFFINSNVGSTAASITEAMQSHQTEVTFYRTSTTNPSIKLILSDDTHSKNTQIHYLEDTTKGLDPGFDLGMFNGTSSNLKVYTHLVEDNQGIAFGTQALPNSDLEAMVIPIGVKAAAGKEITFSVEALNLPTDLKVFLEDKEANIFTRLDEVNSEYQITINEALDGVGRFYLHTATSALTVNDTTLSTIYMYKSDISTLKIVSLPQGNTTVKLSNVFGKELISTSFNVNGVKYISLPKLAAGVYIVEVQTAAGKLNRKIILE